MNKLQEILKENSFVDLNEKAVTDFMKYRDILLEWNGFMNLTAITDDEGIAVKHFSDSLSVFREIPLSKGVSVIDIGTGAGFPGIPMIIADRSIKLTLLDSLNKRISFLNEVLKALDLSAEAIHGRAEDFSKNPKYREKFDYAVSRAVARLNTLCEYCLPYVRTGGSFIAMKGPEAVNEAREAEMAIEILGGRLKDIITFNLNDGSTRNIVVIDKISSSPSIYPRSGVKISKSPIK